MERLLTNVTSLLKELVSLELDNALDVSVDSIDLLEPAITLPAYTRKNKHKVSNSVNFQ